MASQITENRLFLMSRFLLWQLWNSYKKWLREPALCCTGQGLAGRKQPIIEIVLGQSGEFLMQFFGQFAHCPLGAHGVDLKKVE